MTDLNEVVVDENDLVEGMLQGKSAKYVVTKDAEKIDSYNHFCTLFKFDDQIDYETPADSSDKYNYKNADNWVKPRYPINLVVSLSVGVVDGARLWGL